MPRCLLLSLNKTIEPLIDTIPFSNARGYNVQGVCTWQRYFGTYILPRTVHRSVIYYISQGLPRAMFLFFQEYRVVRIVLEHSEYYW